jgi:hypothetical protein
MAISAAGFMGFAMVGQTLWGGVSAGMNVNDMWKQNKAACEQNKVLETTQAELLQAFEEGAISSLAEAQLRTAVRSWGDCAADMHYWAVVSRQQFHKHFVVFLVGLAVVTILLFFAIEKKAGRLDRLFRKIGRISDALGRGGGGQGVNGSSA